MIAAASDFPLVVAGVQSGLFRAVAAAGAGGVAPPELAARLGYREDQVRIWAETLYAIGILDDAGGGRLCMAPGYEALLVPGPPGHSLVPAITVRGMFLGEQLRLAEDLRTGAERSMVQQPLTPEQLRGMVPSAHHQARVRLEHLYARLPIVAETLGAGAHVLEVGCRLGTQSMALAEAYPSATFVGIDQDATTLTLGQELVGESGLGDRVELRLERAEKLADEGAFDLAIMDIVLHEVHPSVRPAAVGAIHRALRPGGILVSNDFHYPNHLAGFRAPEHALAVFDQALEVSWGTRHLTQSQLEMLLSEAGFARAAFRPVELPFPSLIRPGTPVWYLSTVAYKD